MHQCLPLRCHWSPEATTLGASFLAGIAVGTWNSLTEAVSTWKPASVFAPPQLPGPGPMEQDCGRITGVDTCAILTRLLDLYRPVN